MVKLLDYCKISGKKVDRFTGEKEYVATADVEDNKVHSYKYVDFDNKPSRANQIANVNDVGFAAMMNTNKAFLINNINKEYIYSTGFYFLKCNDDLYYKYLYHFINSEVFNKQKDKFSTGATMKGINNKNLELIEIRKIPVIAEQKKISEKLDLIIKMIINRKEQLVDLDNFIKSQFVEMFGDPNLNDKYETQKLITLIKNKGDLVDGPFGSSVNTKTDYIENGEIPVIRTVNIKQMEFSPSDLKYMKREKYETLIRSRVLPGDILLSKVGTIGNVCIFPNDYSEAILSTTGSTRIRIDETRMNRIFTAYNLLYLKDKLNKIASVGVQPFLNMTHIKNIELKVPPIEMQNKFALIVEKIDKQKFIIQQDIKDLEQLYINKTNDYFKI